MAPLHRDRVGLGDIRAVGQVCLGRGIGGNRLLALDRDVIAPDAHARRVEPGLPAADVELPAVPGAAQYLARAAVLVLTGS